MKYVCLLILFLNDPVWAQENLASFFEPEIGLVYNVSARYSQSFGLESRNVIYDESELRYRIKQIDVSHISSYQLNENTTVGLGIQYRFESIFHASEEDELRILQELEWKKQYPTFSIENRLRNEYRIYRSMTKYRVRYEAGLKHPLNTRYLYLKLETESLLELSKLQKPELEQRSAILIGLQLFPKTAMEAGFQYRLTDYTQDWGNELFIVLGLDIKL